MHITEWRNLVNTYEIDCSKLECPQPAPLDTWCAVYEHGISGMAYAHYEENTNTIYIIGCDTFCCERNAPNGWNFYKIVIGGNITVVDEIPDYIADEAWAKLQPYIVKEKKHLSILPILFIGGAVVLLALAFRR